MAEKDRITNPTMGSNEVGSEREERRGKGMPSGTDTQTQLAALSAQKKEDDEESKNQELPADQIIDEEVIIIKESDPLDDRSENTNNP